jgi:stage V sporulation protein G
MIFKSGPWDGTERHFLQIRRTGGFRRHHARIQKTLPRRWIQHPLIRCPLLQQLFHELCMRDDALLDEQLRQCIRLRERLNQKFLDADGCFLLGFSHCSLSLIKQPRQSQTCANLFCRIANRAPINPVACILLHPFRCSSIHFQPTHEHLGSMEITEVKIIPVKQGALRGFVTITFDACFVVHDFQIVEGPNGLRLSMPARRLRDGTSKDIFFPMNDETRKKLEERVIGEYRKLVGADVMRRALQRWVRLDKTSSNFRSLGLSRTSYLSSAFVPFVKWKQENFPTQVRFHIFQLNLNASLFTGGPGP